MKNLPTDVIIRQEKKDHVVYRERSHYAPLFVDIKDCKLLDIGAHVGYATLYGFECGSLKSAVCVEASNDNFPTLQKNMEKYNVRCLQGFVTDNMDFLQSKKIVLHRTSTPCNNSFLKQARHRGIEMVSVISFKDLISDIKPDLIKIDIEYGEHFLDFSTIPNEVKRICIEFHPMDNNNYTKGYEAILSQGFNTNKKLSKNRTNIITFSR